MARGGVYLMISFLAGTVLCAWFFTFFTLTLPLQFLLSIIFLLILCSTTTLIFKKLHKPSVLHQLFTLLSITTFFLLGIANMQRLNHADYHNSPYYNNLSGKNNSTNSKTIFKRFPITVKEEFTKIVEKYIPSLPDRAVVLALTIGDKSGIPYSLKQAYKESGATHLLALSGMHAAIIYGIISFALFFLNFSYKTWRFKVIICAIFIILFTYITGFSASVLRAAIMIIIWKAVAISNRKASRWSAWLISACIILLINPSQIYNIGFQLSYAAVAGIIALYPAIQSSLTIWEKSRFYKYIKPVWETAGIAVACQIATTPLAWYYFNSAPTYFLITNMAAVPLSTITIYSLAAAMATSPIPIIGNLFTLLLQKTVWLLNYIIEYIGMLS